MAETAVRARLGAVTGCLGGGQGARPRGFQGGCRKGEEVARFHQ